MPNYRVMDPEEEIECPYDKSHMIRAKRFPYHLMKCRKNYVGTDFAVCPFNARHEVQRPELKFHIAHCKDKHLIEADIAFAARRNDPDSGTYFKGNTDVPSYDIEWNRPEATEDWDADDPAVVRVGVDEKILNDPNKYRDTTGMRPSEKKEYKKRLVMIEVRKKQDLPYDDLLEDMDGAEAAKAKRAEEFRKQQEVEPPAETQLRLPKQKPRVVQQQEILQNKLMMSAGLGRGRPPVQSTPATNGMATTSKMNGVHKINQDAMILAQLARGRGMPLGRGQPMQPTVGLGRGVLKRPDLVQVPNMEAAANPGPYPPRGVTNESSSSNEEDDTSKNSGRKLQKKLREIDVLMRRQKCGVTLDADQLKKVSQRDNILTLLEQMELE